MAIRHIGFILIVNLLIALSATDISLGLGGGVKFFFTENLGIRLDVRGIYTAINSDASIFCAGGCAVQVRSSGFFQGELGAGLILRFQ